MSTPEINLNVMFIKDFCIFANYPDCFQAIAWRALTGSVALCTHMLPQTRGSDHAFGREHTHSATARRHHLTSLCNLRVKPGKNRQYTLFIGRRMGTIRAISRE